MWVPTFAGTAAQAVFHPGVGRRPVGNSQARHELSFASYQQEQTVTSFLFFIRVERHRYAASTPPRTLAAALSDLPAPPRRTGRCARVS
jgi:hypothetical protein